MFVNKSNDVADEDNDDGARSATSSMSIDVDLLEGGGPALESTVVMEDNNDQTLVPSNASETASMESEQPKPVETDVTMDTDSEKDVRDAKPGNFYSCLLSVFFFPHRFKVKFFFF